MLPAMLGNVQVSTLRVTKIGLLHRKEDILEGGRRAINRKWREWCVLLTGSQLLFFRELSWATTIPAYIDSASGHALFPQTGLPQPDELLTVKDTIAIFDKSYTKVSLATYQVILSRRHFHSIITPFAWLYRMADSTCCRRRTKWT